VRNASGQLVNMTVKFTCAGTMRTPQIERTIRNENPDVPVALVSRIPLQNGAMLLFNGIHVYGVFALAAMLLWQFALPKGTDWHVARGRIVSYGILPWFLPAAWVLELLSVFKDVKDFWAAPPLIDFRGQVSYIVPFGLHVVVSAFLAFYLFRKEWCGQGWALGLIYVEMVSLAWGLVVGMYMNIDMMRGGRGTFGMGELIWDNLVEGGHHAPEPAPFYQWIASILLIGTFWQFALDAFTLRVLVLVCRSSGGGGGKSHVSWVEQHKIGVLMLYAQGAFISGAFVTFVPYCVVFRGWPEWTCVDNVYIAIMFVIVFELPVIVHYRWIASFVYKVVWGG